MSEVLKIFVGVTPTYWLIVCDPPATSKPSTSDETPAACNGARPLLTPTIDVPRVARSIFLLNERSLAIDRLVFFLCFLFEFFIVSPMAWQPYSCEVGSA